MKKKEVSSKKMMFSFIWHFLVYGIILSIIVGFIFGLLYPKVYKIKIAMPIILLILSSIAVFISTKLSTKDIFNKKILKKGDEEKYMKSIIIFFVICILATTLIYALIYSVYSLQIDRMVAEITNNHNEDVEPAIEQLKNIVLGVTCAIAVIKSIVYVLMMRYENKYMSKLTNCQPVNFSKSVKKDGVK